MPAWSAVLKSDQPLCAKSVEARKEVLRARGIKRVRIKDPAFGVLYRAVMNGELGIVKSRRKHSVIWSMPNADHTQFTLGMLDFSNGTWRAAGWAAEHLVCIMRNVPMPDLESFEPILKPRVRRLLLELSSECCFCTGAMPLDDITIEHWLAKSLKGSSRPDNLKLAHRRCNERAGSKTIGEKKRLRDELTRLRVSELHHHA